MTFADLGPNSGLVEDLYDRLNLRREPGTSSCSAAWVKRCETMRDPRLNTRQSLDLAFEIAELLRR